MKPQCQLCLTDFTSLVSQPSSPAVPLCGHAICFDCLKTKMKGQPCYLRCGVVRVKDVHPIRLKYVDTELPNWKQILDSKSHKRLQELNLVLDKQATVLDDERVILAKTLQDYLAGMALEQALHELCAELTMLEAHDITLRQQITQEIQTLGLVEKKIACISMGVSFQGSGNREDNTPMDV